MRFTDKGIAALKAKEQRYEVWEPGRTGLGVRVSEKGRKSWVYMYRFEGRPRRMTLGTYPETGLAQARLKHSKARADLDKGIDPGTVHVAKQIAERQAETVNELVEEYLKKWAYPRKRSAAEDERILRKDVLPKWGKRKAKSITRRDAITLLDAIMDRGKPIMANRTLAVVRKVFKFGVQRDILETSPIAMIQAPGKERKRDRILSDDEIKTFWAALDSAKMLPEIRIALRLILVTGQRPGEVAEAHLGEIDAKEKMWTVPGERVKNGRTHRVPLSPLAENLVEQAIDLARAKEKAKAKRLRRPVNDDHFQFLLPCRYSWDRPLRASSINHALKRVLEDTGIADLTPHDLRRTAGSGLGALGFNRFIQDRVLNHADNTVGGVYDRYSYDKEKRRALDAWAHHIESLISDKPQADNVVKLATA